MNQPTHAQTLEAVKLLGIDPGITTEVHMVVRDGGMDFTVVQYALDDQGRRYFDPDPAKDELAKVTTTMRIEQTKPDGDA